MIFCEDVDLLHWEPNIFRDAVFASQLLVSGQGDLSGAAFTISSGSLAASHVAAGNVIVLSGTVAGCYPIVSVDSDTELTISVMYDGLFPDEGSGVASPVGMAAGLDFAIRTFWPQRQVVSELLKATAGVGSALGGSDSASIVNAQVLRRPCVLGTLQMIYNALAAVAPEPSEPSIRAALYARLYRRSVERARVELDLNGDGKGDVVRTLNVLELKRA